MKVFLYFIGKPRDQPANALVAEYLKRTSRYAPCESREVKPTAFDFLDRHPSAYKIFLDPAGKQIDSPASPLSLANSKTKAAKSSSSSAATTD